MKKIITMGEVKRICTQNDWKLKKYSDSVAFFDAYKIGKYASKKRAFSLKNSRNGKYYIFYRDSLFYPLKIYVLCHEIGHIEMGHCENSTYDEISKNQEAEADKYAFNMLKPTILYYFATWIGTPLLLIILIMFFALGRPTENINEIITETTIETAVTTTTITENIEPIIQTSIETTTEQPTEQTTTVPKTEPPIQTTSPATTAVPITTTVPETAVTTAVPTTAAPPETTTTTAPTTAVTTVPTTKQTTEPTTTTTAKQARKTTTKSTVSDVVYITPKGNKYHKYDCYHIQNSNIIEISREDAVKSYEPCKTCHPDD